MYLPDRKRRIAMRLITSAALLIIAVFAVLMNIDFVGAGGRDHTDQQDEFDGTYPWETLLDPPTSASDFITYADFRDDYCLLNTTVSACATAASGKYIRFDTAEELYRFSLDVSFEDVYQSSVPTENYKLSVEKITFLLSLNYTLGGDIDYSVMGAKTFIPIGHWFTDVDSALHKNVFTGTFDGRGFAIFNLYLAGYDDMIYVDYVDEITTVDIAVSHYYSMFTYNEGTIRNIGLVNPTLELLDVHIDLNMTSNLVGFNQATGVVDHVFVVDNRASVTDAGIRYKVGTATGTFTAAGIVHTNEGSFTNSYYSSKVVVNGSYINKFIVQPVLYVNSGSGTYGNLVYDSTVYLLAVTVGTSTFYVATPNAYAVGEATATLKSSSSSLNTVTDRWYFFASDTYPQMLGLEWNDTLDEYEIADAIDLVAFSRVVEYVTQNNGVSYPATHYHLIDDIDMSEVAPDAYVTPSVNFTGILSGQNGTTLDDNFYIYNLHMTNGIVRETNYYAGLFSIVSGGTVTDLNIADSSLTIADSTTYYSNVFGIGFVAGRMIGGTMQNLQLDVSVDLGSASIGETHLGMLVGRASGTIDQVSVRGTLDAGIHTFESSLAIAPNYYIGGIVGSSIVNQITISDSVNNADILGFSTTSTFGMATGYYAIYVKMGGIVGYMINTSSIRHRLIGVSNKGDISVRAVTSANDVVGHTSSQNVGGVFGELSGYAPILESSGNYLFANLYNIGVIGAVYGTTRAPIRAAGIGVSNTTQSAEYALLFNHAGFTYNSTGFSGYTHFRYTGTILDISAYNAANTITISRAYNYANFTLDTAYYLSFSPLYLSLNNNRTLIRYSTNSGDLNYLSNAGANTITQVANTVITGITASTNTSFQNVINKGDITIVNRNVGTYTMTVGGLTATLTSGEKIVNSLNQGNIVFAKMAGSANLYVAGIAAYNYSGDLQSQDASAQPIATIGIIDSINYGNITTSYGVVGDNLYGITGTSNAFVGGIASLNAGSIQNCANLGTIGVYNSYASGTFTAQTDTSYAGRISAYTAGVSAGGIVSVVLSGNSRIYDIANNGDIVVKTYKYARAGGILAVCLYTEANSGAISGLGLTDTIETSILSNGLNLGNVSAITNTVAAYGTGNSATTNYPLYYGNGSTGATHYVSTKTSSEERPAVYSSAGGVIGYGLSVMRRMLNHGTISATDVAGGIVGATYVTGAPSAPYPTTTVNINTAINYGDIKSIDYANFANISSFLLTIANVSSYYMADGNTFIFPTGYSRLFPLSKRGFGGVFGRLQRGTNGTMTAAGGSFDFIVNADPDIDLIGRLDQVANFSSSGRYFLFNNALYYSAKQNDTTQTVFTGFYYAYGAVTVVNGSAPYNTVETATTVYKQVGLTSTTFATPATSFVWPANTSSTVGSSYYALYAPVSVPYITESEQWNSDFSNYMYDASFVMRKDANSYSANIAREYTVDGSGNLKNPDGTTVIAGTLLFATLAQAQAYKVANPASTPYYYDANGDIRNLAGVCVFSSGVPYSTSLAYKYYYPTSVYHAVNITTPYTTFSVSGGALVTSTPTVASTYIFASSAAATTYDQIYNTAYYRQTTTAGQGRGLYNAAGTKTHSTDSGNTNYTYIAGTIPAGLAANNLWRNTASPNSFYLASNHATLAIDSTMIFTTQAAATAYAKKLLFYWTGTAGASNLQQLNGSIVYTYVSGSAFTYNGYDFVYSAGMFQSIPSAQLFANVTSAYNYKVANPTKNVYYIDPESQIQKITLKTQYYQSTNFSLVGGNLVDSIGAIVLPAADLDGSPYTINGTTGHITNASGVVVYSYIPSLTKYIYYLENNLLASRFSTSRPNGMYVLSTTAGSTYGLVIPSNIRTDDIRPINEDHTPPISLLQDYDNVSVSHLNSLDAAVLSAFDSLKQSTFNDKSALVEETTSTVVLDETGGSGTRLTIPVVDYDSLTVTFSISMEAYTVGQTTASYAVESALTSAAALIAKRGYDQYSGTPTEAQMKAYNDLLYPERASGISTSYPPLLTITLPSRSITSDTTLSLGYFTVYSEAYVNSDLFWTSAYYTDYQVFITFTPTIANSGGSIQINTVQFNGGGTVSVVSQTDVTALGNVNPGGSLRFNFTYSTGILATGYDFKDLVTIKYTDGTVVSSLYYTLTSVPADSGTYSITVTFSTATRSGDYYMYYRYFSTSTEMNVKFDKSPSTSAVISALDYYSEDDSTVIAGTTITGAANVGYDPGIGGTGTTNFTSNTDTGIPTYLDRETYLPDFMTTGSFVISPFSTLTNVYLNQVTLIDGYKTFDLVYVVTAEDGTTTTTYHHYITGREIDLVSVLKNGNEVFLDDVYAVREDAMTTFTVDLGLDQLLELYSVVSGGTWSYFGITVTAVEMDGVTPIATEDIVGLTYDTDDYLLIYMSYSTRPGIYTFSFVFYRDGQTSDYITIATPLVITKQPGTNSFLSDIRFSQLANETNYPIIRITDVSGTVLTGTGYNPLVYFNGIDYDGADEFPYYYYRVDGQVSNTPLDSYMPYFMDYLPYGGSVARYVYNPGTLSWYWTAEVTANSTSLERSVLLADYTIDPLTGMEPAEGQDLMILYRVTAEDGLTYCYYYTTVTDVTYNVTLLFDVYYCTGAGGETCTLAKQSVDFDDELVIITVKNFDTNGDDTVLNVTDPAEYPTFSAIQGLNNQVTQFHFTYDGDYRYSFGRNISGFYVFSVSLPEDQYLNDLYTYEIEFSYGIDDYILANASGYVAGLDGKYFYIEASTRNRTRRFNIYIRAVSSPETDAPWGLFDFFRSWWD